MASQKTLTSIVLATSLAMIGYLGAYKSMSADYTNQPAEPSTPVSGKSLYPAQTTEAPASTQKPIQKEVSYQAQLTESQPLTPVSGKSLDHPNGTESISGKITHIDEDSFVVYMASAQSGASANFEFEHLRIKADDGERKIYQLIVPGPTNYLIGDSVSLQYKPLKRVTYEDLTLEGCGEALIRFGSGIKHSNCPSLQRGYFNVDGIVQR